MTIDLNLLSPPQVVETLEFETILAEMVTDLQARDETFDAITESDPAYKVLEVCAYREVLLRARVNDAAKSVMLAYAAGTDLDHLAAPFGVTRLVVDEGDPGAVPPVAPTYESDDALRKRVLLAPEAISTAGATGSYEYHALTASPLVKSVDVSSPSPGEVVVTVLSTEGNGAPAGTLLTTVEDALDDKYVRPLTDHVTVQAAAIVNYTIDAEVYTSPGPDAEVVRQAAEDACSAYVAENHALGMDITISGLYAALHQPGVRNVVLTTPPADVDVGSDEAAWCTSLSVTLGGDDE